MSSDVLVERLAIIGLGLIGGSIAAAARHSGVATRIVGNASGTHGREALELGLVDEAFDSVEEAVGQADAVFVAVPVPAMPQVMSAVARALGPSAWVSDCCSTKASATRAAHEALTSAQWEQYVPGHPIAGSEHSGPSAARAGLFQGKAWLLSPQTAAQEQRADAISALLTRFGAQVSRVGVREHDAMFAEYSHMPHALVFALCHAVANGPHAQRLAELAGAGFKDTSRIGASAPALWTDILLDNSEEVLASMERVQLSIDAFKDVIAGGDRQALLAMIRAASDWRARL